MWPNGQVYDGDFKHDDCNGFGTLYYPDGKRFEGNWKDGKKNGKGKYIWPNGSKYAVNYSDGVKKDQGKLESENVSMDQLKSLYGSLSKKAAASINALNPGQDSRGLQRMNMHSLGGEKDSKGQKFN